jgi:uncharacterized protein YdeI (YjbR/CyaY-like superfamily)
MTESLPDGILFRDAQEWRVWLEAQHASAHEIWLIIQKARSTSPGLRLRQAVEEALCFGWIDSQLTPVDEYCYLLRFSPRTQDSIWSIANIKRVKALIKGGQMTPAGERAIQIAKENGQWQAALDRERTDQIPEPLEKALRKHKGALEAYKALPDSKKKRYLYWLQTAKKETTLQKRIAIIIEALCP